MNRISYRYQRQNGAVFVTGLIFLLALSLLGITAAKMATIEERMSANMRDRMLAMQAAEMALRYAEHHIRDNDPSTNSPKSIEGMSEFDTNCTDGFCYYGAGVDAPNRSWETYCNPKKLLPPAEFLRPHQLHQHYWYRQTLTNHWTRSFPPYS